MGRIRLRDADRLRIGDLGKRPVRGAGAIAGAGAQGALVADGGHVVLETVIAPRRGFPYLRQSPVAGSPGFLPRRHSPVDVDRGFPRLRHSLDAGTPDFFPSGNAPPPGTSDFHSCVNGPSPGGEDFCGGEVSAASRASKVEELGEDAFSHPRGKELPPENTDCSARCCMAWSIPGELASSVRNFPYF